MKTSGHLAKQSYIDEDMTKTKLQTQKLSDHVC